MTNISGHGQRRVINDTRGRTSNSVGGSHNDVLFKEDKGANNFKVGGRQNKVDIRNLGSDDKVTLEGKRSDWIRTDGRSSDGEVVYKHKRNGNEVTVRTDDRRTDSFVKSRVEFTGRDACEPHQQSQRLARSAARLFGEQATQAWPSVGRMTASSIRRAMDTSIYQSGYARGFADGAATAAWTSQWAAPLPAWDAYAAWMQCDPFHWNVAW